MIVKILKRKDDDFKRIVGHEYKVLKETEDGKGYYIILGLYGCCRVEKDEIEIIGGEARR